MLSGKKIILGITASIAAYKAAFLVRLLVKAGAEVKVVLSPSATDFVSPLTLATLSKNPVITDLVDEDGGSAWNNHVEIGLWADLMIIAPCTANTLAKMATAQCDNMLMAVYLSAKCPVYVSPAMDLDMYKHPGTKANLETLASYGHKIVPAEHGELASGLVGEGRMAEPEHIVNFLVQDLQAQQTLSGKKVLITAGPTHEAIDPVRFIGNRSSGKMGFELAKEAVKRGATVYLIAGPVSIDINYPGLEITRVESAMQMFEAATKLAPEMDVIIATAAVADYRPAKPAKEKIKKDSGTLDIQLEKNPDILKAIGESKTDKQVVVGFALETENEKVNAEGKLKKKNCDFLVLNSLKDSGAGFQNDTNKISILDSHNNWTDFSLKSKEEVASDIWNTIYA